MVIRSKLQSPTPTASSYFKRVRCIRSTIVVRDFSGPVPRGPYGLPFQPSQRLKAGRTLRGSALWNVIASPYSAVFSKSAGGPGRCLLAYKVLKRLQEFARLVRCHEGVFLFVCFDGLPSQAQPGFVLITRALYLAKPSMQVACSTSSLVVMRSFHLDRHIEHRAKAFLASLALPSLQRFNVTVSRGVAYVNVRVPNSYEWQLAVDVCQRVTGIREVVDSIKVDLPEHFHACDLFPPGSVRH